MADPQEPHPELSITLTGSQSQASDLYSDLNLNLELEQGVEHEIDAAGCSTTEVPESKDFSKQ